MRPAAEVPMVAAFHALFGTHFWNLITAVRRGITDFADRWKEWHRYSKEPNRSRRYDPNQLDAVTAHAPDDHPRRAADRLAIRAPIDAYAHCADRHDTKGQMALFGERKLTVDCTDTRTSARSFVSQ
jgi:hypothetical protein